MITDCVILLLKSTKINGQTKNTGIALKVYLKFYRLIFHFTFLDFNECLHNRPCKHNGTCLNNEGSYECECTAGWTGHDCQTGK